ncbi:MAG: cache domain-containing protein, partial [Bacilli bacterium]|nr:cache domain-containing protein [Bacilli bacterium]
MKKFKNITIGGIQQKIFNLVLITIILMMAAFAAVVFYQSGRLTNLVRNTNEAQNDSITSISEQTMTALLDSNMLQSIQMEAYIAEDLFDDTIKIVNIIADYTSKLFANPGDYPARDVELPDINKDGEITMQVLKEEGVDLDDPTISAKLGLIGNLSELMMAVYSDAKVDSCYCALPDGVMLLVDDHSKSKFDDNGNLLSIPIRERLWYTGAVQSRKIHFTDVTTDLFTNEISIMCSLPVYQGEELVAVIGADLFLNDVSAAVNATARSGSFVCIVNQNGHVLFSPQTTGEFRVVPAEEAEDLRQSSNTQLAAFINDAMSESTNLRLIELSDGLNYVAGAPIASVGWAIISVVPKSLADLPTTMMIDQLDTIKDDATISYNKGISQTKMTIIVLLAIIVILAITAS